MKCRKILEAFQALESKSLKDVVQEKGFFSFALTYRGESDFFPSFQNACRGTIFSMLTINGCPEVTGFIQAGPSPGMTSNVINTQYCYLNNNWDAGFT